MIVRTSDESTHKKNVFDDSLITDVSNLPDDVSLDFIEVEEYFEKGEASFNRVYHIYDGAMKVIINDREIVLRKGDGIFIEKGMNFEMTGTFKAAAVHRVAV
ncbi:MAG TPA: hypothetical protein VLF93_03300 [Candidatus Saccharimonadales bacterium]|nr:hypothetical protein [Candidatus Saccharimonadales bacterium]